MELHHSSKTILRSGLPLVFYIWMKIFLLSFGSFSFEFFCSIELLVYLFCMLHKKLIFEMYAILTLLLTDKLIHFESRFQLAFVEQVYGD